ncbi:hypothetical protein JMUB590_0245 [Staphylococcus caprae]|uniref:Uncharacterized protein n=1 Tax=Staphylococcus caprae TaxID=29380 RepID=A0ABM7FTF7_9STAP|nr:hypothetical protein DWB96_01105 [Staphylococcus caprae]BBD88884.1 hypothetical protein JMUB145_0263 [Staphylococcus caprae]BBD91355.1 hypothetical protein JMUB590_0245 [Staphylococcus caprae]BBD93861.1 hypothetical protein JMUB898_0241 [Staphylococcus caprae]
MSNFEFTSANIKFTKYNIKDIKKLTNNSVFDTPKPPSFGINWGFFLVLTMPSHFHYSLRCKIG